MPSLEARGFALRLGHDPPLDAGFNPRNDRGMHAFPPGNLDTLKPFEELVPHSELAVANLGDVLGIQGHQGLRA